MQEPVSGRAVVRAALIVVALLFVATSCRALPIGLLQPAEPSASAVPTTTAPQTSYDVCVGVLNLGLAIDGLRDENLEGAGVIGMLGAVGRALVETEGLASAVDDIYTPLTSDLGESLVDLRDTLEGLDEQRTLGASVATVGASIAEIGVAMDALSLQLQTSCLEPIVEAISAEDGQRIGGRLIAMALVLAIAVNSSSLESGFLNLLVVLFVGFLVFSLIVMRRVSRSDASSSGGKGG